MRDSDHIPPLFAAPVRLAHLMQESFSGSALVPRLQLDLALAFWRGARRQARAVMQRCQSEQEQSQRHLARLAPARLPSPALPQPSLSASTTPQRALTPSPLTPSPLPPVAAAASVTPSSRTLRLPSGETLSLRPMQPSDGPALAAMLKRTTPDDRRLRFLSSGIAISDALIAQLTGFDRSKGLALCAFLPGSDEMIAVARLHADEVTEGAPAQGGAEFAVLVRSDWHGHGLGHALMEELITAGQQRGYREIWGHVLAENLAMVRMCHHLGFRRDPERSMAGLHVMARPLVPLAA